MWDRVPKGRKPQRETALEICIGFPSNLLINTKPLGQKMKYPEDKQRTSGELQAKQFLELSLIYKALSCD